MKIVYLGSLNVSNFTFQKEYVASPSFVAGFVSIIDDNGAEQLIRMGDTRFSWIR